MRILLVEDDDLLSQVITEHLTAQHYVVDIATDGLAGFDYAQAVSYDLIVLDINLPRLDGIQLCQLLRQHRYTGPILLLTANGESSDKVLGLDAGADDYMVKPCAVEEMSARIRALLRRPGMTGAPVLTWGDLCLDPAICEVTCNGQLLSLSPKEYSLLELFLRNPQRTLSSSSILERLWSFEDIPGEETVRSHIKRLRHKLKTAGAGDLIETVYGMGYRLKPSPQSSLSSSLQSSLLPGLTATVPDATPEAAVETAAEDDARAAAIAVWDQFKQPILERMELLDQAVSDLEAGHLSVEVRKAAAQAAHKLAGSLAMFGFPAGTQLSRDLEEWLQSPASLSVAQVKPLVDELHTVLRSPVPAQSTDSPPPEPWLASPPASDRPLLGQVLVVDPDLAWAQQLKQVGKPMGIQITVASEPTEAYLLLATQLPQAILVDIGFQEATAEEPSFLTELKEQFPQLPIVLCIGQDDLTARLAGVRQGCDRFVVKSTPLEDILTTLQKMLPQPAPHPVKVLAVDDDPVILERLNRCLPPWQIQVTTLTNPETLWQTLETIQPDLIILDVEMPVINGIELCQIIRRDRVWCHIPILFLTARQGAEETVKIYQAGADDYISKPFTDTEVVTRILNRLERNRLLQQTH